MKDSIILAASHSASVLVDAVSPNGLSLVR